MAVSYTHLDVYKRQIFLFTRTKGTALIKYVTPAITIRYGRNFIKSISIHLLYREENSADESRGAGADYYSESG